jgi:triosephosphate isomerase
MRRKLVAGNWKMNGSTGSIRELLQGILGGAGGVATVELAVFPPFVYLEAVGRQLTGTAVGWGAQNLSEHASGAYTGEVAGPMLKDFGCTYAIVGHSERRTLTAKALRWWRASTPPPARLVLSRSSASARPWRSAIRA